jgi:glycosyltransferase involved in cell wall biosynthesis
LALLEAALSPRSSELEIIMKILVFNPGSQGGIAKYCWHQAEALGELGIKVVVLCDKGEERDSDYFECEGSLVAERRQGAANGKLSRIIHLVWQYLSGQIALFGAIRHHRPEVVLLASYLEYLSPVWVWLQLAALKIYGVTFAAVLHDPVRNFVVGPTWWHKLSVGMAYWPITVVFTHEKPPPEASIPDHVKVREVPHGLFFAGQPQCPREQVRGDWGIPDDGVVFLSFGFIRDSKNLDLLIRALPSNPAAFLVVMGRVQSESANRPVAFYQEAAKSLGVDQRVKFLVGFVPDEKVVDYLQGSDVLALTYSASFRSQSGVLNTAAHAGKPLLASAGPGPLRESVEKFGLGTFVAPDDAEAVADGMRRLIDLVQAQRAGCSLPEGSPRMDWPAYREYASWENNARAVAEAVAAVRQKRSNT